ncbi:CPBP family glutamic-type intramembrane protease [Natrinema caseinilyticum]|uniref:CPBP family glutamic-type intramembrane protease n=1 Tax=Natrinema caseinilyticum TaxID=2961570 RepID=UPI003CCDA98C
MRSVRPGRSRVPPALRCGPRSELPRIRGASVDRCATVLGLVGAIFGYAYERTGNLFVLIAVHTGYNLVLMAVSATAFV